MTPESTLSGLTVLQRGWLSSNNVLLHDVDGCVLVDSSHVAHAGQTVALVRHALGGAPLARVVNTHLHSDHCGGNAALQRAFGCDIVTPPGLHAAVLEWDEHALGYAGTGHRCERFTPAGVLNPGAWFEVAGRRWDALAAPGHDPHSLILFDARDGVAITADALWENGFGVVFPELDGESAFDEVARSLDLIESLAPRHVIPGHGAPFTDVDGALRRARSRLDAFVADPQRHHRHAVKVMFKYHLLEVQSCSWPELLAWLDRTSLSRGAWERLGRPGGSVAAFAERVVAELVDAGQLAQRDGWVFNA